jgi:chlorobactene lauroyltransferase
MIPARKSKTFARLFALYNRNLLARKFEGVRVAGLERLREFANQNERTPLVLYANHSSSWDGLVPFQIVRAANLDGYAMTEERQLRQFKFLRLLGAFSVVRERPREAIASINYAAEVLGGTKNVLLIFPQGLTLPNDVRPLKFHNGLSRIVEKLKVAFAAPLALRYEFLDEWRPFAFARVGAIERIAVDENFDAKRLTQTFADNLTRALDAVRADILRNNLGDYVEIVAPHRLPKRK